MTDRDSVTLPSGRTFYANNGLVGIGPDLDEITEGYDGGVWRETDEPWVGEDESAWTAAELVELADLMIERWTRFRAKHEPA